MWVSLIATSYQHPIFHLLILCMWHCITINIITVLSKAHSTQLSIYIVLTILSILVARLISLLNYNAWGLLKMTSKLYDNPKCNFFQKQPSRAVLRKRCSENMQQICRRTPMPKCDFNKVTLQLCWNRTSAWVFFCKFAANNLLKSYVQIAFGHGCSPANFEHIFRIPFPKSTSEGLLLILMFDKIEQ